MSSPRRLANSVRGAAFFAARAVLACRSPRILAHRAWSNEITGVEKSRSRDDPITQHPSTITQGEVMGHQLGAQGVAGVLAAERFRQGRVARGDRRVDGAVLGHGVTDPLRGELM
jgi:hypothetical protein